MSDTQDFERMWLAKFATCLDQEVGEEVRKYIMEGSKQLSSAASREDVIQWTQEAMQRLDRSVDDSHRHAVMTGCACRYPASDLQEIRSIYAETEDLDHVHSLLQQKFETFLRQDMELEEELIDEVVSRGWGLAGFKEGKTIIATKIPKSGNLKEYFEEVDPQARRELYCHCPRVRDAVPAKDKISISYCYCGAGFYKALWEEITQEPVYVEVLESVLAGDDACKIAIYLP
ncbi:MAG TPA: hypothetical protein VFI27_06210 [candidate division Zixibacteria bacterium]|nr:hypothetical protein [candidate division Zixibacteria bacterium]